MKKKKKNERKTYKHQEIIRKKRETKKWKKVNKLSKQGTKKEEENNKGTKRGKKK